MNLISLRQHAEVLARSVEAHKNQYHGNGTFVASFDCSIQAVEKLVRCMTGDDFCGDIWLHP